MTKPHASVSSRAAAPSAPCGCSRRDFLHGSLASCSGFVLFGLAAGTLGVRRAFAQAASGEVVRREPFARMEKLAEGVWAMISTPWGEDGAVHGTTFSNGGIVAGRDAVLCIEGFNTPAGAAWLSDAALEVAGRRPDLVVVTHLHPDHVNGLAGYRLGADGPHILSTGTTARMMAERRGANLPEPEGEATTIDHPSPLVLPDREIVETSRPTTIDLGGRTVSLVARRGHTPSDLTVVLDDPRIVWTGDLVFNGLFPYYGDAIPSALQANVREMVREDFVHYVPGHGAGMKSDDFGAYLALLEDVETAARRAIEAGTPAEEAWKEYSVPDALGEWKKFRPDVHRFAFEAWERELVG